LSSPIEKLNQVIIENEKKYNNDQALNYKEWEELPSTEKTFYKAVRLFDGIKFIKNTENLVNI
jgi:hypothetical protein